MLSASFGQASCWLGHWVLPVRPLVTKISSTEQVLSESLQFYASWVGPSLPFGISDPVENESSPLPLAVFI